MLVLPELKSLVEKTIDNATFIAAQIISYCLALNVINIQAFNYYIVNNYQCMTGLYAAKFGSLFRFLK